MQVDEKETRSSRTKNTFNMGDSRNPIPFISAPSRHQMSSSQSVHQFGGLQTPMGLSATSLASFTKRKPTYIFDRTYHPAAPFEAESREIDLRTKVISELLVYPETDISRNNDFYRQMAKPSDVPMLPTSKENREIRCICQQGENNTRTSYACCTMCDCWSHLSCYMLNEGNVPQHFFCLYCQEEIVKSVKKPISVFLNKIAEEIKAVNNELSPIAHECLKLTSEYMLKIITPGELTKIGRKLERVWENAGESWQTIKEQYGEIQKVISSLTFVNKQGELDGNDWIDGDTSEARMRSDGDEEDGYTDSSNE